MKKFFVVLALTSFTNVFAGIVPRLNCVGTIYDKDLLNEQEITEEKVLLEYKGGGAAFYNTFQGNIKDYAFLVLINKMYPILNIEAVPSVLIIHNSRTDKTYIQRKASLFANGTIVKVDTMAEDGNLLTLSCSRLLNP